MPSDHTSFPASSSHRWLNCPFSITKGNELPDPESSIYALAGTAAHSLGEYCIKKKKNPKKFIGKSITIEKTKIEVTEEMSEAVNVYVKYCLKRSKGKKLFGVESKNYIAETEKRVGGTADFWVADGETLEIIDYKNGVLEVDPHGNSQLVIYALALLDSNKILQKTIDKIRLTIVQPNKPSGHPVLCWDTNREELETYRKNIYAALKRQKDHPNQCNSGPWCHWCKVEALCPQLKKEAEAMAAADFDENTDDADVLSVVESMDRIKSYIKAVNDYIWQKMIGRKGKIKGLKVVKGRGKRVLVDKNKVIREMKKADYHTNVYCKAPEILPLTKLEKVISNEVMDKIITYQDGKEIVVLESDKREEYISAKEDFE